MHNLQARANRDAAIRQGVMRQLYGEGTGSVIDEYRSVPYQGAPRVWPLLTANTQEGHSATAGVYIVLIKNQTGGLAAKEFNHEPALQAHVALSPASVLERARAVFGLNISEAAEVFGITRQTTYQWMKLTDMEQVRAHENRDRLKQLFGAAQLWQNLPPLKGRWLYALLPSGNTLFDLLKAHQVDRDALQAAYQTLAASTTDRRREEGERATQAATALAGAFAGIGAGRKDRKE